MQRVLVFAAVLAAWSGGSPARAGDAYDNQIKMTMQLVAGSKDTFQLTCQGIGGTYTESTGKAKCVRGMTTMMIGFVGDGVTFGMIAYPATPKDIRGLWGKARQVFGPPDSVQEQELTWFFDDSAFASAMYDDEHSMFAVGMITD